MSSVIPPRLDDPAYVRAEYADDAPLAGRIGFWSARTGPQPQEVALRRVLERAPRTVLEVGCGRGEFAGELAAAGIEVTAVDQSDRMVALTAARGVRALQADVQDLPFGDRSFDVAVANYMLYHVPDLPRALGELGRVLRRGGALVAVTNAERQLHEMWRLVGRGSGWAMSFRSETGEALLAPHFAEVVREDVEERFTVTADQIRDYLRSTRFAALADAVPELPDGLRVTAAGTVFIAAVGDGQR